MELMLILSLLLIPIYANLNVLHAETNSYNYYNIPEKINEIREMREKTYDLCGKKFDKKIILDFIKEFESLINSRPILINEFDSKYFRFFKVYKHEDIFIIVKATFGKYLHKGNWFNNIYINFLELNSNEITEELKNKAELI